MVIYDAEETSAEEDQEDPNVLWTPDEETINFNAATPMLDGAPTTLPQEAMSSYTVYTNIKLLSSFISRARVNGDSIQSIARKLLVKLRGQAATTHRTLQALAGEIGRGSSGIDPGLYEYLLHHLRILIHDKRKGNPRHKCTRTECQKYCILPMYARRCLSDTDVQMLFQHVQNITIENDSLLLYSGRTTVSKNALNILKHIVSLDHHSVYNLYDVLLAMSGHKDTILNPMAKVDSKLYGLIFDLIRYNYYARRESRCLAWIPEATASLPWLNPEEYPNFEEEFRHVIQQATARNTEASATNSSSSRAPPAVTDYSASRVALSMTYYRAPPAVTDSSAPPPSYGSVIGIPPSASNNTDDGLPSYEEVLNEIVDRSEN